jgi:hypothetical protein
VSLCQALSIPRSDRHRGISRTAKATAFWSQCALVAPFRSSRLTTRGYFAGSGSCRTGFWSRETAPSLELEGRSDSRSPVRSAGLESKDSSVPPAPGTIEFFYLVATIDPDTLSTVKIPNVPNLTALEQNAKISIAPSGTDAFPPISPALRTGLLLSLALSGTMVTVRFDKGLSISRAKMPWE